MTDFIVIGIIALLMVLIIKSRVKAHKLGNTGGCGCGCSGCSSAASCGHQDKH